MNKAEKRTGKMKSLICEHFQIQDISLRSLYNKNHKLVMIMILSCPK